MKTDFNSIQTTSNFKILPSLHKKCPYLELFWSVFSRIWTEYGEINTNRYIKTYKYTNIYKTTND